VTIIGITERGDASLDTRWKPWVRHGHPAILITKNPGKLARRLAGMDWPENIIVHSTITGYGGSALEPGVPAHLVALEAYQALRDRLGGQRAVLRVDPIVPLRPWLQASQGVIRLAGLRVGDRVRVSFLDNYKHVRARLAAAGAPALPYGFHAPLDTRIDALSDLQDLLPEPESIEVCGEPGIVCDPGCVSHRDLEALSLKPDDEDLVCDPRRQDRRREGCGCIAGKHELLAGHGPCAHGCLYCYWHDGEVP